MRISLGVDTQLNTKHEPCARRRSTRSGRCFYDWRLGAAANQAS